MAGMFYSLEEVAEKLNKTEEQVKQLVREGKLREFRDGPNLLFKVDEVEELMSEISAEVSMSDTVVTAPEETSADETVEEKKDEDEISLTTEDATPASELTEADTIAADEGISVLGETDRDYQLAEDTMGETQAASDEASLEEIEEDVNLDTFGSGSGLLDLSLQADDTSLGGILDEIYTPGSEEGQGTAAAGVSGSAMDMAAETEQMLAEAVQPGFELPAATRAYAEPEPDTLSNALGIMLFLPVLVVVYTAIVTVGGFNDIMPAILGKIQDINGPYDILLIWYIMAAVAVLAILIIGMPFMLSGKGAKAVKKPKAQKVKQPKAKKEKKQKKKKDK